MLRKVRTSLQLLRVLLLPVFESACYMLRGVGDGGGPKAAPGVYVGRRKGIAPVFPKGEERKKY